MNANARERSTSAVRAVLDRYADAWQRGDMTNLQDCYHELFTLHYFGHHSLSGTHSGKTRALDVLRKFSRLTQRRLVRIESVMAGAERGALLVREQFGVGTTAIEMERVLIYSIADDRLRECWVYDSDPGLLDRYLSPR